MDNVSRIAFDQNIGRYSLFLFPSNNVGTYMCLNLSYYGGEIQNKSRQFTNLGHVPKDSCDITDSD